MMERMNFSRLNMTGLGTARVNSSGITECGDSYELIDNALLLEKMNLFKKWDYISTRLDSKWETYPILR